MSNERMSGPEGCGNPRRFTDSPYHAADVIGVQDGADDAVDSIIDFGSAGFSDDFSSASFDSRGLSVAEKERKRQALHDLDARHVDVLNRSLALADMPAGPERDAEEASIDDEIRSLQARKTVAQEELGIGAPRGIIGEGSESDEDVMDGEGESPYSRRPIFASMVAYLGKLDRRLDRKLRRGFRHMRTMLDFGGRDAGDAPVIGAPADSFKLGGVPRRDPDQAIDVSKIHGGEGLTLVPPEPKVTGWGAISGNPSETRYAEDVPEGDNSYHKSMSMETPQPLSLEDQKSEPKGWGAIDDRSEEPRRQTDDVWGSVETTPEQRRRSGASSEFLNGVRMDAPRTGERKLDTPVAMNAQGEVVYDGKKEPLSDAEKIVAKERIPESKSAGYADYLASMKAFAEEDKKWYLRVRELIPKLTDPDTRDAAKAEIEAIRAAEKDRHDGATLH